MGYFTEEYLGIKTNAVHLVYVEDDHTICIQEIRTFGTVKSFGLSHTLTNIVIFSLNIVGRNGVGIKTMTL